MSTNLHIKATREIIVKKTGAQRVQEVSVPIYQTPTRVTYKIMDSDDRLQAYFDWVKATSSIKTEPVYDEDDILCEGPSIGELEYNPGEAHISELRKEIEQLVLEGYEIEFEAW